MANSKKRKYHPHSHHHTKNPRRGPPGILFTCHQGLEQQCRHDALALLQREWDNSMGETTHQKLSLDEEVRQLQQQQHNHSPFQVFDTRCKGVVIVLCTTCPLWVEPYVHRPEGDGATAVASSTKKPKSDSGDADTTNDSTTSKQRLNVDDDDDATNDPPTANINGDAATTKDAASTSAQKQQHPWDPIQVIERISADATSSDPQYPSSRCIARLVPFQASCYPSLPELQHTLRGLLLLLPSTTTPQSKSFAIRIARRLCALTRPVVLDALAATVGAQCPDWTVDLTTPATTITVELHPTVACLAVGPTEYAVWRPDAANR